ncbi:MAG TPA: LUD domain-containing protein [Saprospiraceae bacterium]|nr:LUD domain-containing protein [Saprospiraceae bacterium]
MSKQKMLQRIRQAKPEVTPLPEIPGFAVPAEVLPILFKENSEKLGSRVLLTASKLNLKEQVLQLFPDAKKIASPLSEVDTTVDLGDISDPHELADIDVAIIRGQIGVAENGAIWVDEQDMQHRVLPFITQHLVILLSQDKLVYNMHQAYAKTQVDQTGFGVFIAGPSKTADIEQSLVIGAQGPRSLTVILD